MLYLQSLVESSILCCCFIAMFYRIVLTVLNGNDDFYLMIWLYVVHSRAKQWACARNDVIAKSHGAENGCSVNKNDVKLSTAFV